MGVAGLPFARAGLQAARARRLDVNASMTLSAIGAALLGEWGEGAMVVVLFALGGALQAATLDRTRGAGRALTNLLPPDALLVDGTSAIDQRAITGESIPVDKSAGDAVFAGAVNGPGGLLVEVTHPAANSTLARIIHLVEEAHGSRAPSQQLVDRFAGVSTPLVIALAAALALGGWGGEAATPEIARLAAAGQTPRVVLVAETPEAPLRPLGLLGLADTPRPEAAAAVARRRRAGIGTVAMLSGDVAPAAEAIGRAVGVDEVAAGLLPRE